MFLKKSNFESREIGFRFYCEPESPGRPIFLSLDIEKSVSEPRAELRQLPRNMFTRRPTKIVFLQNFWSCLQDYRGGGRRQKLPLDGATDFL